MKNNPLSLTFRYLVSVTEEGRKVIWPARSLVIKHTAMVAVATAISGLIFGGLDYGLSRLLLLAIK
ncbi:MAG: preprotein translocase subunit SecE [Patescibacteria group bacterium]